MQREQWYKEKMEHLDDLQAGARAYRLELLKSQAAAEKRAREPKRQPKNSSLTVSRLIEILQAIKDAEGNLPIFVNLGERGRNGDHIGVDLIMSDKEKVEIRCIMEQRGEE